MDNKKIKVLFICTGNICRSPLAHRLFERKVAEVKDLESIKVDSCGIGAWHEGQPADARMRKIAQTKGWILEKYARQIKEDDFETFDYLVAMDRSHVHYLKSRITNTDLLNSICLLRSFDSHVKNDKDVPDPYYGGITGFENVYNMIERSCTSFLTHLINTHRL